MKLGNTSAHQSAWRILALIVFAFAWPVDANAQWTVSQLHPAGASRSWAIGIGDGEQAGFATVGGADHAGLWSGNAFLGSFGTLPPGEGGLNMTGGLSFIWRSHHEKELLNNDKMQSFRRAHFQRDFPALCADCGEYDTDVASPRFER